MSFNEQLRRYNGGINQTPMTWELNSEEVIPVWLDISFKWFSREGYTRLNKGMERRIEKDREDFFFYY